MIKVCIILLCNLIFYFKTLGFKYVSDDIPISQLKPVYKNKWHKRYLQFIGSVRISPQQDHAVTMFIHAFICVLIYLNLGANNISFLAALLFTFNPANNQGSIWISGRGYTIPTLLLLVSLSVPILSPFLLYACSSFTAGYLAPLALLGSKYAYILLVMPVIWFLHRKKFKKAVLAKLNSETFEEDKLSPKKIILAIKTFGFYLSLCIVPFKICFYHNFLQSCAGNDIMRKRAYSLCKFFWIGLTTIITFVIYSIYNWNITSWGFLWFAVCIAPYSNLRRLNQEIAERFVYIANIGLMLCLASLIVNYPIMVAVFLTMYIVKMWSVMEMYMDDYYLVEHSVIEDKIAWYGWHIRGHKRWDNSSYREALIMWVMAKMISPKEFKVLINIAIVLRLLKNIPESDQFLQMAQENMVKGQEKEAYHIIAEVRKGMTPMLI